MATKVASLAVRTLAKPIGNSIKQYARDNDRFRGYCVGFAQWLHRIDMRMRLGLLQDPAVIDRQVKREQEELEKKRNPSHSSVPTAKTKGEAEAEEKEKEEIKKRLKNTRPRIRPLSESKAIDTGATFISEGFLFMVAVGLILGEQYWSRTKAQKGKDEVEERLGKLEEEVVGLRTENQTLKAEVTTHGRVDGALGPKLDLPTGAYLLKEAQKGASEDKLEGEPRTPRSVYANETKLWNPDGSRAKIPETIHPHHTHISGSATSPVDPTRVEERSVPQSSNDKVQPPFPPPKVDP